MQQGVSLHLPKQRMIINVSTFYRLLLSAATFVEKGIYASLALKPTDGISVGVHNGTSFQAAGGGPPIIFTSIGISRDSYLVNHKPTRRPSKLLDFVEMEGHFERSVCSIGMVTNSRVFLAQSHGDDVSYATDFGAIDCGFYIF